MKHTERLYCATPAGPRLPSLPAGPSPPVSGTKQPPGAPGAAPRERRVVLAVHAGVIAAGNGVEHDPIDRLFERRGLWQRQRIAVGPGDLARLVLRQCAGINAGMDEHRRGVRREGDQLADLDVRVHRPARRSLSSTFTAPLAGDNCSGLIPRASSGVIVRPQRSYALSIFRKSGLTTLSSGGS